MPRTARAAQGGSVYHVLNRGNHRAQVFHDADDYAAFARLLREANAHLSMRVLAWCLMPNHFHAVLWPVGDGALAAGMHGLLTPHARRYPLHHRLSGHVWQGRFHAFPIQEDDHLLTVVRYVERNALRANLVGRAEDWLGSSLQERLAPLLLPFRHTLPVPLPGEWLQCVNEAQTEAEMKRLRQSVVRGCPLGAPAWMQSTALRLGLESSLRPRGRPPRQTEGPEPTGPAPLFPEE